MKTIEEIFVAALDHYEQAIGGGVVSGIFSLLRIPIKGYKVQLV